MSADLTCDTTRHHDSETGQLRAGRSWSLLDMIDFTLSSTVFFLDMVSRESALAESKAMVVTSKSGPLGAVFAGPESNSNLYMSADDKDRIEGLIKLGVRTTNKLELEATYARLERLSALLREPFVEQSKFATELRVIRETANDELRLRYFFYYQTVKAKKLRMFDHEWSASNEKFKSAKESALNATDCYALGHPDACVFHCMRVLEVGLRVLAKNVGLTFDTQQWKNIIDEIETKIRSVRDSGIPGLSKAEKDKRLQFLSESAKEFFYFKDGWRNFVAHGRDKYDDPKALSVLEHTRAFMNHLASQLSEESL